MKQIRATQRMLSKYHNKHKESLYCSKCERRIKEDESLLVTTHHVNYYCSDCAQKIEI